LGRTQLKVDKEKFDAVLSKLVAAKPLPKLKVKTRKSQRAARLIEPT
jgi:hypothetical protein